MLSNPSTPILTTLALLTLTYLTLSSPSKAMDALPQPFYHNPILATENLADPHMIKYQGKYYLYGTYLDGTIKGGSDHYDVFVSEDMTDWEKVPNIFSKDTDTLWAPDVFYDPADETFYLYYSEGMSIGIATSKTPIGPFEDRGILIEQAIDAHMFYDNGKYYLYHSSVEISNEIDMIERFLIGLINGTHDKARENIWVQPMSTPMDKSGQAILLVEPDVAWEQGILLDVNEGVWMFKSNSTYYLMYSGNETMFGNYAIGYATSTSPVGPFEKYKENPIVKTKPSLFKKGVYSPGHHSILTEDDGSHWMIYHQKKSATHLGFSQRYVCKDQMYVTKEGNLEVFATGMRKP